MKSPSIILFSLCFVFLTSGLQAQVTNSEASAEWLASKIVSNAGGTTEQYMVYSRSLAKTLSQFSAAKQTEILGESAPAGGTGTGGTGTGGTGTGGGSPPDPMGLIDDENLSSGDLLLGLLDLVPLDEDALTAALERIPPLDESELNDLLAAQGPVSNGFMVSSLTNADDSLSSGDLKAILISNSPVKPVVLSKMSLSTKMTALDKAAVLAAQ